MENKKNRDYGQQFVSEVERALESGDFDGLNHLVTATVGTVISETAEQVAKAVGQAKTPPHDDWQPSRQRTWQQSGQGGWSQPGNGASYPQQGAWQQSRPGSAASRQGMWNPQGRGTPHPQQGAWQSRGKPWTVNAPAGYANRTQRAQNPPAPAAKMWDPAVYRRTGSISGTLLQVFGGIGVGLFGTAAVVLLTLYFFFSATPLLVMGICSSFLAAGGGILLGGGNRMKARLKRSFRYFELCRKTGYVNISRIAEHMSQKEGFIIKELRHLIENGTFPQGHLDKEQQCFMLTDAAYAQYQELDRMRQKVAAEEQEAESARRREEEGLTEEQRELRAMLEEGVEYIRQIKEKNDAIPGEVISRKLDRMESLLREIFKNLEQMPEQMPKMHRLMHYYLPTVLKLVTAYEQFDRVSVPGEDVTKAKQEIENTLDTINDAFGELLNKLFSDTAMDVTTDAQVLKTMLVKEGLVEGGMENDSES